MLVALSLLSHGSCFFHIINCYASLPVYFPHTMAVFQQTPPSPSGLLEPLAPAAWTLLTREHLDAEGRVGGSPLSRSGSERGSGLEGGSLGGGAAVPSPSRPELYGWEPEPMMQQGATATAGPWPPIRASITEVPFREGAESEEADSEAGASASPAERGRKGGGSIDGLSPHAEARIRAIRNWVVQKAQASGQATARIGEGTEPAQSEGQLLRRWAGCCGLWDGLRRRLWVWRHNVPRDTVVVPHE
jgi:hypothetical protein